MGVFHRGIFNTNQQLCTNTLLYFRSNRVNLVFDKKIILYKNNTFITDTYFNSLSVLKLKKYTSIEDVFLNIDVYGIFSLNVIHKSIDNVEKIIYSEKYHIKERTCLSIEIENWIILENGIVYFEIVSDSETFLYGFNYSTNSPKINDVKLAIVITHFNRQEFLIPALDRIKNELYECDEFSEIKVYISDNSQNLNYKSDDKIIINKNKNFGGSGGFTFGLLKAREDNFTHCLFMDDDASTEIESIKRTYNLLSYMRNPDMAILGAMLFKEKCHIQHENGSKCKSGFEALHNKLDLSISKNLIENDKESEIEFGGWWFFCFKIENIQFLPFPFFVRGDDVTFSLANKFSICTFNGIASWQDDFRSKHNAYLEYLNLRSSFVMNLVNQLNGGYLGFLKLYLKSFIVGFCTYRYNSCLATSMALNDILEGEDFWNKNINMSEKRKFINNKFVYENIVKCSGDLKIKTNYKSVAKENFFIRFIRVITLNGILIPNFFLRKEPLKILYYTPSLIDVFGYKTVHYYNKDLLSYVECRKDYFISFKFLLIMFFDILKIIFLIPFFYKKYKVIYFNLTRTDYWERLLGI